MSGVEALAYWMSPDKETFVAEQDDVIVGTYFIRPNQAGGGGHVCNCGYMTRTTAIGRGVARSMCQHSLAYAVQRGYRAMQFNFVVSTNERAVRLWQSLGFEIVGRLPAAFRHPVHGYVDALVMYQPLTFTYRRALPSDIAACIELRGKTRENAVSVERLRQLGVTQASWSAGVASHDLPGYVCLEREQIVGYVFANKHTGEIVVLALLPEWEGKGIGKRLLQVIVTDLAKLGFRKLFLGCSSDPQVRSYGFYRHLGWKSTGTFDANQDEVLELMLA
jgi:ribosomal protein S18 acetylase RimI-like enzyme